MDVKSKSHHITIFLALRHDLTVLVWNECTKIQKAIKFVKFCLIYSAYCDWNTNQFKCLVNLMYGMRSISKDFLSYSFQNFQAICIEADENEVWFTIRYATACGRFQWILGR